MFLVFQIVEKRTSRQLEFITESTIEEQLEADDISYTTLPNDTGDETYISGKRKTFTSTEINQLQNQSVSFLTEKWIVSRFNEPISLSNGNVQAQLKNILKDNVIAGDSYKYWGWNIKTNKLLFFQTYQGKPLYFNEHAMLSIQLNEDRQIISYEQTLLTDLKEILEEGSNQDILPPIKAIENLYKKNYLQSGNDVTKVEMGYYKNVPISGDVQFFAPTWHIVVDGKTSYFVNAIEGQVMELIQNGVETNEFAF